MAIFLAYSTSSITSDEKVCHGPRMTPISSFFHGDEVVDDVTEWP